MMRREPASDVPDLILERYHLGELPRAEAERVERRLHEDSRARDRLAALEESDRDIARRYPPASFARRASDVNPRRPRRRHLRRLVAASAVVAGALAAALALPWTGDAPATGGDRIKGLSPTLIVYRRTGDGSETLADGAPARAGDLVRVGYLSGGRAYGVILSLDGRGIVTLHLPPNGTRAAALRSGGTVLLDDAYELDDAPAWERFYFVTADRAFEVGPILDAARRAAARDLRSPPEVLPVPRGFEQSTFSLQKEVKP